MSGGVTSTAMKHLVILSILVSGLCPAQTGDGSLPASSNVMGAQYPRVHPDLRAAFQLKAPDAQKVQVQIARARYDVTKGQDGVWSVTTPPLVVGFHYYSLIVDGVAVNDPGSRTFFGTGKDTSGIEIPEKGVDYYDPKPVPHGDVRARLYFSKVTGKWRRCFRMHSAGLRHQHARAVSRSVPATRHGGGRNRMDDSGAREPDSG